MKTRLAMVCTLILAAGYSGSIWAETTSNETSATTAAPALSDAQKQAYALGVLNAKAIRESIGIENLDTDAYSRGFQAAYTPPGDNLLLSRKELQDTIAAIQKTSMALNEEKQKKRQTESRASEEAYLKANAAKPGVKTTASGLQYEVIKEGAGTIPKGSDTVKVSYKGTLVSGEMFDQNDGITFNVQGVIPGWTEALKMMKVGAKYRLVIPSNLAYGDRGAGRLIAPGATLVFEVELLAIQPPATPGM